jgi:zinc D-Ala-D-Ala carboxypeptidase
MESTQKLRKKKLSKNLSYAEAIHSETAKKLGISNEPTDEHYENMLVTAEKLFQPLRDYCGHPIRVNSMYRSAELNKAIGGSKTSQHRFAQALDLDTLGEKSNADLFHWASENLNFDQLIWEFGTDLEPDWIHISYVSEKKNRKQKLRATNHRGKTRYSVI